MNLQNDRRTKTAHVNCGRFTLKLGACIGGFVLHFFAVAAVGEDGSVVLDTVNTVQADTFDLTPPDCLWVDHFKDEQRIIGRNNLVVADGVARLKKLTEEVGLLKPKDEKVKRVGKWYTPPNIYQDHLYSNTPGSKLTFGFKGTRIDVRCTLANSGGEVRGQSRRQYTFSAESPQQALV